MLDTDRLVRSLSALREELPTAKTALHTRMTTAAVIDRMLLPSQREKVQRSRVLLLALHLADVPELAAHVHALKQLTAPD